MLVLKIALTILSIAFLGLFAYYTNQKNKILQHLRSEAGYPEVKIDLKEDFKERWEQIENRIHSGSFHELRLSIIEADTLIEDILKNQGLEGDNLAELLSHASLQGFLGVDKLWQVHKIRNRIVHDASFDISAGEAETVLKTYKEVLEKWGVV